MDRPTVNSLRTIAAYAAVTTSMLCGPAALPQASNPGASTQMQQLPVSWIDQSTGHRVIRLTNEPGSRSLYFNYTAFTPDGKQMVYAAQRSIFMLDLQSRKSRLLANGPVREIVVSKGAPLVYFMKVRDQRVYLANVQTGELRVIAELPARANIETANADDTLLAGTYVDSSGPDYSEVALPPGVRPTPAARMTQRVESKLPMVLFTLDLRTKAINPILHSTDWISHLQFSPKDPSLLMYCHEGLWQDVDRIWTIHTDGTANTLIHKRTQEMEIAGHEFWDADGKTIWYDLQVPKGQTFFLASYNTESGQRMRYQVDRNSWSIHFNVSKDGKLFCGDGGDSGQVAGAEDGEWIELFHPQPLSTSAQEGNASIGTGILVPEHLVNMSKHDYKVEPNVRFTPDNKWVIFASNMLGANYVFAVETELAQTPTGQ